MQYHDSTKPIGIVTERVETPEGVMFAARISATRAGDESLTLAQDGVLDSVSVGATPTEWTMVDGVMHVTAAVWSELSMVSEGAFADAKIHQIAAQSEPPEEFRLFGGLGIPFEPEFGIVCEEPTGDGQRFAGTY